MQAMAKGDRAATIVTGTKLIETNRDDEFGVLAKTVNGIIEKTQGTVAAYGDVQVSLSSALGEVMERLKSLNEICINNLLGAMQAMAKGDRTASIVTGTKMIEVKRSDDFGTLATMVNGIIEKTQGTVLAYGEVQTSLSGALNEVMSRLKNLDQVCIKIFRPPFRRWPTAT